MIEVNISIVIYVSATGCLFALMKELIQRCLCSLCKEAVAITVEESIENLNECWSSDEAYL